MRQAQLARKTKETDIQVTVKLDNMGTANINTGIGFFDHMLTALSVHSGISMDIAVKGDLYVDGHHTVEDTGIVLGKALGEALGDKSGITRYGSAFIPMDEALAFCSLDISNRPFLVFQGTFTNAMIGQYDACLTEEFFRAFAFNAGITLHVNMMYGSNDHHKCEAAFKAVAHALKTAVTPLEDGKTLSTKESSEMIAIIDYGAGNIFSVKNALDYLGLPGELTADPEKIRKADALILPGVGAFPSAMQMLHDSGLTDVIREESHKKPFLGICLGMQLIFEKGYEFEECDGLGLVPGKVEKIEAPGMVIPHMGWNKLEMQNDCPILRNLPEESYVYFVHSYQAVVPDEYLAAYVEYGTAKIPAMVYDGKTVYGAQFHPEKSGEVGLQILRNFGGLIG